MRGPAAPESRVDAIVKFMHTLAMPDLPKKQSVKLHTGNLIGDLEQHGQNVERGQQIFESLQCEKCHTPPLYTSSGTYDVDLSDDQGNIRFNPPSLRGIQRRRSFFHDGRVSSLREVFATHRHQLPDALKPTDLDALECFLNSI